MHSLQSLQKKIKASFLMRNFIMCETEKTYNNKELLNNGNIIDGLISIILNSETVCIELILILIFFISI